jgi:hypothetical protein
MLTGLGSEATTTTTVKPTCAFYQKANEVPCMIDSGPSGCDISKMYYQGCSPNWLLFGGITAATILLLSVGRR